ncbi:pyridoxal phosphate-dependent aminotransferase [Actinoplanes sp. OR16]|uniref:pyridoxal phosphate-dependent aminotransferase n=1 Tax=Actinoplanes sp. OR16 TaxID=946334 RepID=UPI0015763E20|nr:pyridoxal phosphate-dependent aminotransferase [Actinoplanes sp. OR16]
MTVFATSPMTSLIDGHVRYDLAESTCPPLTVGELASPEEIAAVPLGYGTTRGDGRLRGLVAAGSGVGAEQVLITVGAVEAMFLLAQAVCGPGDHVVVVAPCFPPALTVPAALKAEIDIVRAEFDSHYRLPLREIVQVLGPRTKLVSLASPQNPAGVRLTAAELRELDEAVRSRAPQAVILVDETYHFSTYGDAPVPASAAGLSSRVVTCGSVSKAHGAPGLRLGWLTVTDPDLYDRLREAKFNTTIACSGVDEFLATRVLERAPEILAVRAEFLRDRLDELRSWASRHGVEMVVPDGGPLCCLRAPDTSFYQRLEAREVRVAPGSWFREDDRVFRLGFGHLPAEDFGEALERLGSALQG